ncbi:uncharacterized protein LOC125224968 [Leguminivora glycinivorella]|uniref:uncharacterized protein LOC125224968 n=1 Tax=Leguminivora glycinivorella TaxID=1035111 RepID=UPI00200EA504|nr:uncharacterized protein LOC125224968 [Leguminivora glycinivorella]
MAEAAEVCSEEEDNRIIGLNYLNEWGLSPTTIQRFADNDIGFTLMEEIQDAELKELVPNLKERILFKKGLQKIRGIIHETASEDTASISDELVSPSSPSSTISSGISEWGTEKSHEQIDLKDILKTTSFGELCLASPDKPLNNAARNQIVRIIVEYHIKRYKRMTSQDFDTLSNQIVKLFPSEYKETYYIPTKLPTRYRNQIRVLRKAGVKPLPTSSDNSSDTNDDNIPGSSAAGISPEVAEEYKLWLKFNKEPWTDILDKWNQTRKYRLAYIAEERYTILDILTEWPSLKMSLGYKLVEADFDAMHPHCELNLFKKWPLFMAKARPILKNLKSPDVNLLDEELEEDARDYIFFKLMSYKMPPTVKVPIKENGKKRFYKPSIVESQNSFILHVTNQSEIKTKLEQYQKMHLARGTTFQPLVIVVGPTSRDLQHFYVAVESVLYKVDQLLKAVDVCFKLFNTVNLQYPLECLSVWQFIQRFFYDFQNKNDKKISCVYCFISDLM